VPVERQANRGTADEPVGTECAAQSGEQSVQCTVGVPGPALGPKCVDHLRTWHLALAVHDEIREQQPALPTR